MFSRSLNYMFGIRSHSPRDPMLVYLFCEQCTNTDDYFVWFLGNTCGFRTAVVLVLLALLCAIVTMIWSVVIGEKLRSKFPVRI